MVLIYFLTGLGKYLTRITAEKLKKRFFSVIIDETTDVSIQTKMAIVCSYWSLKRGKLMFVILDLVDVSDVTSRGLTNTLIERLEKHDIPTCKIVGFSADTCSVMFGRLQSVSTLLRAKIPNIATIKCSCHSLHLCAKHAYSQLPPELVEMLHLIPNTFKNSQDRREKMKECLKFLNLEELEILKPGETRWLSLKECADRILLQLDALILHFTAMCLEQPSATNNKILHLLKDPFTKIYLEFFSQGIISN